MRRWPALRDANGNIRGYAHYLSFDIPLVLRMLAAGAPDLYVAEPPPTTGLAVRLVAALHRRPYVWYAADVWSEAASASGAPPYVVRLLRAAEGWVMRGAVLVLSVSDGVTGKCAELGVPPERILTVGNGVDTEVFRPDGEVTTEGAPYFVYTGTMSEWQDAAVFIRALERYRRAGGTARLVFLGQGSELPRLKELAGRLAPEAVDFLGVVPPEDAARWLRGATAALVSIKPGLGYDFAKPTKIYAATACGTPVIFAGRGAGPQLVQDASLGWAVDHDDSAVASAMGEADLAHEDRVESDARRERLVEWTRSHASLSAAARTAAAACVERARAYALGETA